MSKSTRGFQREPAAPLREVVPIGAWRDDGGRTTCAVRSTRHGETRVGMRISKPMGKGSRIEFVMPVGGHIVDVREMQAAALSEAIGCLRAELYARTV